MLLCGFGVVHKTTQKRISLSVGVRVARIVAAVAYGDTDTKSSNYSNHSNYYTFYKF